MHRVRRPRCSPRITAATRCREGRDAHPMPRHPREARGVGAPSGRHPRRPPPRPATDARVPDPPPTDPPRPSNHDGHPRFPPLLRPGKDARVAADGRPGTPVRLGPAGIRPLADLAPGGVPRGPPLLVAGPRALGGRLGRPGHRDLAEDPPHLPGEQPAPGRALDHRPVQDGDAGRDPRRLPPDAGPADQQRQRPDRRRDQPEGHRPGAPATW